tara:strand:- start:762 stop:1412 length:651 start_codon:yes stop_codon:yes gene_type:complete
MRSKEEAHDYRYFPCPDLPPLKITQEWINSIQKKLPELPDEKKVRFIDTYEITKYDAEVLTMEKANADFFEEVAMIGNGKLAANWIINELFGRLNKEGIQIGNSPISSAHLKEILSYLIKSEISSKMAKSLFDLVWTTKKSPSELIDEHGMKQVTDHDHIEKIIDIIIEENPQQVEKVSSNPKIMGWFVGQVMKASNGKANPKVANQLVAKKLGIN